MVNIIRISITLNKVNHSYHSYPLAVSIEMKGLSYPLPTQGAVWFRIALNTPVNILHRQFVEKWFRS